MKKMLFLLLAAGLSFTAAQAQTTPSADNTPLRTGMPRDGQPRTPEQRAAMQTQRLTTQLTLTPEQQPKVREIFLAQANRMETLRGQRGTADRQAMMQQMQDARTSTDEQLKGVLTAEQFAKYQQQREERAEQGKERLDARGEGKMKTKSNKVKTTVKA